MVEIFILQKNSRSGRSKRHNRGIRVVQMRTDAFRIVGIKQAGKCKQHLRGSGEYKQMSKVLLPMPRKNNENE